MARARNIKPGFFKNELLVELPFEYRILFVGLWTIADRDGRLEDRPVKIKMEIFPADNVDVNAGLNALHAAGFILRYEADGKRYCQVLAWDKHQNPHFKEAKSTIPAPGSCVIGDHLTRGETDSSPVIPGTSPADSLIPDSLVPTTSGEQPPPMDGIKTEPDPIFGHGLAFLRSKNVPERGARSFLGSMRKSVGDLMAAELLAAAESEDVSDPIPWLRKAAEARQRAGPSRTPTEPQSRTAQGIAILESMKNENPHKPRGTMVPQLDFGRSAKTAVSQT